MTSDNFEHTQPLCAKAHRLCRRLEVGLSLFNRELFVFGLGMVLNIVFDLIIGHDSRRGAKIAPGPDVLAPIALSQVPELHLEFP